MFTGDEKVRFVNLCRNNNLKIWKLYNDENAIIMNCDKKDFTAEEKMSWNLADSEKSGSVF